MPDLTRDGRSNSPERSTTGRRVNGCSSARSDTHGIGVLRPPAPTDGESRPCRGPIPRRIPPIALPTTGVQDGPRFLRAPSSGTEAWRGGFHAHTVHESRVIVPDAALASLLWPERLLVQQRRPSARCLGSQRRTPVGPRDRRQLTGMRSRVLWARAVAERCGAPARQGCCTARSQ